MAAIGQSRPAAPSSNIRTPLFIAGVALALLAFLLMLAFGLLFAKGGQNANPVQVVVASRDIDPREAISPDLVTVATLPSNAIPPHAFLRIPDLNGFSARVQIYKGQVVTANLVASNPDQLVSGDASTYLPIPAGYVAITLPSGEQQAVAGFIAQGDYINVIVEVSTDKFSKANPRSVTRTVFTNVHVIRVGPQSVVPRQGVAQGLSSSITVVMTLCDAQYMNWFLINASVKYALIPYKDYLQSAADPACTTTSQPAVVGPSAVNARWHFMDG